MNGWPETEAAAPATTPWLTTTDAVATIRLNRPRQHNRIDPADIVVLHELIVTAEADPTVRVLVLTGTGASFSSGYDLSTAQTSARPGPSSTGAAKPDTATDDGEVAFSRLCDRVEAIRVPTICALNGGVYGGSTDLALACDFRIGVTGMRMRMPAAQLGIHFYPSGLRRYVSRLGLATAKRLFLTAETIGAEEMLRVGFLDRLVEPEALEGAVAELAARIAACAPQATAGIKRSLNDLANGALDDRAGEAAFRASLRSDEFTEALKVWSQRKPS
ncbi:enoyl-CoA hydratase/isomerase family protein [Azospirillum doebereinerae]|uniref:Enoyl-CoA hydratase/isomerase family protein n=1 Tax=Azospirillum doebereinerae TaxID=92933 RepID=A0A433J3H2_9PROT|nr:enoyl-CoA hydratase/isomerase family protein [Azospirillum doebereinerae]RUQ66344.1 enoyl-CoA hydratase/isomerase family protein [Azospirillum doebereinerae]